MTSVFIVRPFGKKRVTVKDNDGKDVSVDVDFDKIDKDLIQAALIKNGLVGKTTGVIAEAGNIRVDMFQMLVVYDLVIADISIDNANVFYELGIRHGLRPNGTILIRFATSGKDVPFDLKTDRYIGYDREDAAASVDLLTKSISDTIETMRRAERRADSPVFLLLPELTPPGLAKLTAVPREFQEAVEKAEQDAKIGPTTLALLGEESKRNDVWAREGLRLIGRAQRRIKDFKAARETWEAIRKDLPDDVEANLQLATIFQRLGDLVSAVQACRHVLDNPSAERKDRADARSQMARNIKSAWVADLATQPTDDVRRRKAVSDERLIEAFEGYRDGFAEDLNDYYSGINALGLLSAIVKLGEMEPGAWAGNFPTKRRAESELDDYRDQLGQVRGAVAMSLENARRQVDKAGKRDDWLPPSEAQYRLLTAENPDYVRNAYQAARIAGGGGFATDSEAAQVAIFHSLGLFPENCAAAFEALGAIPPGAAPAAKAKPPRDRILVATGHRADAADRKPPPRFPNTPDCIGRARAWLRETVAAEKAATAGAISGIGGAASGADLLFHEVCAELGVPTTVVLPIPVLDYCRESVADGGPVWVEKFNDLVSKNPPIVLSQEDGLPPWAAGIGNYGVFQRGNIWVMEDALLRPNADVTLVALWNGKAGDGPGGTKDMVELARAHGAKVLIENTQELFGLGP